MLRIAICDDNVSVCRQLKEFLTKMQSTVNEPLVIAKYYSAEQLWKALQEGVVPDLIFLDIEMPGDNGLTLASRIREERDDHDIQIAYISAKDQYMRQAFSVHPIHFLVKPLKEAEVQQVVEETLRLRPEKVKFFQYTQDRQTKRIPQQQILYLIVRGKTLSLLLTSGEAVTCRASMKEAMQQLSSAGFIQINQSEAINPRYLLRYSTSQVYLKGDVVLAISPRYKKAVLQKLRGDTI